jgi:predicted nucleotidyltransferase
MKRDRATGLLTDMPDRLEEGLRPTSLVEEVHLFGSCARGALEPGDVDLVVRHTTDDRWLRESLHAFVNAQDSSVTMRQALRGRRRGISFHFQERSSLEDDGIELEPLWRKGEPPRPGPATPRRDRGRPGRRRAPHDHVLPEYQAIADRIPRPVRIELRSLHTARDITVSAFPLGDAQPRRYDLCDQLRERIQRHRSQHGRGLGTRSGPRITDHLVSENLRRAWTPVPRTAVSRLAHSTKQD